MPSNPAGSPAVQHMLAAVNAARPGAKAITANQYRSARADSLKLVPVITGDEPPTQEVVDHCAAVLPTREWWSKRGARDPRLMLLFLTVTGHRLLPEYVGATTAGAGTMQAHLVDYLDDRVVPREVQLGTDEVKRRWAHDEAQASVTRYRSDPESKAVKVLAEMVRRRRAVEVRDGAERPQMSAEEEVRDFLEVQNYRRVSHSWVAYNDFEIDAAGNPLDPDLASLPYGEAEQWAVAAPLHALVDSYLAHDGSPEGTRASHEEARPGVWDEERRFVRRAEVGEQVRQTQPMLREIRDALTLMPIPTAVLRLTAMQSAHLITRDDATGEPRLEPQHDRILFENFLTAYAMFACMKQEPGA